MAISRNTISKEEIKLTKLSGLEVFTIIAA